MHTFLADANYVDILVHWYVSCTFRFPNPQTECVFYGYWPLHMGLVTGLARLLGRILQCVHMGNFSPVDRMNSRNATKMAVLKLIFHDCHSFVDSCNFTNKANSHTSKVKIHTRPKLCHFGHYVVRAKLFCWKSFIPVTGLGCSYGKIFIPVTELSVEKTEISVTGPAWPLIWTHQYFYKEKSGQARSRKPS